MRLTIDEYCKKFKISKEMIHSKMKAKKLDYIIEEGKTYIVVAKDSIVKEPKQENPIAKPKTTVAMVLALYQKENSFLKNKIAQLESKIDKLIDDKEQMLRAERDKIEEIYSTKDEQLKNILELINKKLEFEQESAPTVHEVESFDYREKIEPKYRLEVVELKEYLKLLNIKSSQRKMIKKRFFSAYDNDARIIHKNGKIYLDFSKYDYSDLLAY